MTQIKPAIGQRVRHYGQGPSWRVVAFDADTVSLSGPGPCRSLRKISMAEFLEEWVLK